MYETPINIFSRLTARELSIWILIIYMHLLVPTQCFLHTISRASPSANEAAYSPNSVIEQIRPWSALQGGGAKVSFKNNVNQITTPQLMDCISGDSPHPPSPSSLHNTFSSIHLGQKGVGRPVWAVRLGGRSPHDLDVIWPLCLLVSSLRVLPCRVFA